MSKPKELPTQEYLKECFDYNEETGILTWRERPLTHFKSERSMRIYNKVSSGKEILSINSYGYRIVSLNGHQVYQHRLIWKLVTGNEPVGVIDHIDNDKSNNRIFNLRDVDIITNASNKGLVSTNKSGYIGVNFHKHSGKYRARKTINKVRYDLGLFDTAKDAHVALTNFSMFDNHRVSVEKEPVKQEITYAIINELLYYHEGILFWKERESSTFNKQYANKKAGNLSGGYIVIKTNIFGSCVAHRLIYMLCNKLDAIDSEMVIDHIDNNTLNNKIENLRLITRSQNAHNSRKLIIKEHNPYKGVTMKKGRWTANISVNRKQRNLGMFNTPEEAHQAYQKAASELHGDFANFG